MRRRRLRARRTPCVRAHLRTPHAHRATHHEAANAHTGHAQVLVHIEEQSPDIGQGVHGLGTKTLEEIGAGDQGHMFGYATDETPELMPLTHMLATQIGYQLTKVRVFVVCVCVVVVVVVLVPTCPARGHLL